MRFIRQRWWIVVLAALSVAAGGCAGDEGTSTAPSPSEEAESTKTPSASPGQHTAAAPTGTPLSKADIAALAGLFDDNPLTGGQVAPRHYKWVNDDVAIFVQFDDPDPAKATTLRYVGVSVKGVFCAENQPGGPGGGFPHFHRVDAPEYAEGHGGPAGTPGYWLSWVAVDSFTARDGRQVKPGVDYAFSPTPQPPNCEADKAKPAFDAPGAGGLTQPDVQALAAFFDDHPLTGGQEPPRLYKWVNENVAVFAQFDDRDPAKATALPYIGISVAGEFCANKQPHKDFPHFHRWHAAEYAQGHGQTPGDQGAWLLWLATDSFESRDGRQVKPGVDRAFSPTPVQDC